MSGDTAVPFPEKEEESILTEEQALRAAALGIARNTLRNTSLFAGSSVQNFSPQDLIDVAAYILGDDAELSAPTEREVLVNVATDFLEDPNLWSKPVRVKVERHFGLANGATHQMVLTETTEEVNGQTSDGYHTFDDLYRHRMLLSAALWDLWDLLANEGSNHVTMACKSKLHHDGEVPFGGGWFIVSAQLPRLGQISYHYQLEHWDLFSCPEVDRAPEWDGHTAEQAAQRLEDYLRNL